MFIILLAAILLLLGISLLLLLITKRKTLGILLKKKIYQDTSETPGEILYAKTIPLCGKPDYIIKTISMIFPVEVKTGKTPTTPYPNHEMQLMAYCFLIEENFGIRPIGGYLRYPHKQFKIAYTNEAKEALTSIVAEMMEKKQSGEELFCNHPAHNL